MLRQRGASVSDDVVDDNNLHLHVKVTREFLGATAARKWWDCIVTNATFYRVCYKSSRFGNDCETPCWTNFYGGNPAFSPYQPIPEFLKPLVNLISQHLQGAEFNAVLLRLYADGKDNIAWHTDGRTFLGPEPTIASLSLGASALFEMRKMRNVWPGSGDNGVETAVAQRSWNLKDGDLLVMSKDTQAHWHHRVPQHKSRGPRININFRFIEQQSPDAERGQHTFYKYMVSGDGISAPRCYADIIRQKAPLLKFFTATSTATSASEKDPIPSLPITEPAALPVSRKRTASSPPPVSPLQSCSETEGWTCTRCTFINHPTLYSCELCDLPLASAGKKSRIEEGDKYK